MLGYRTLLRQNSIKFMERDKALRGLQKYEMYP